MEKLFTIGQLGKGTKVLSTETNSSGLVTQYEYVCKHPHLEDTAIMIKLPTNEPVLVSISRMLSGKCYVGYKMSEVFGALAEKYEQFAEESRLLQKEQQKIERGS